tara:strand:- start:130 stop:522 length:393 start_codon:yes stop_codon:yes gene_type:complete
METRKYSFGRIDILSGDTDGPQGVKEITGVSHASPEFISRLDERVWEDCWTNRGANLGMTYNHGQDGFEKRTSAGERFTPDEVTAITNITESLLSTYAKAAKNYNNMIAAEARKEREKLIDLCVSHAEKE